MNNDILYLYSYRIRNKTIQGFFKFDNAGICQCDKTKLTKERITLININRWKTGKIENEKFIEVENPFITKKQSKQINSDNSKELERLKSEYDQKTQLIKNVIKSKKTDIEKIEEIEKLIK